MTQPAKVTIIGAGIVGLCTAWFLQERGVEVTVLDRSGVAAGASLGNAGWVAPALTLPLPEPSIFKVGIKAVIDPTSPVYVPVAANSTLLRFLAGFARHSTPKMWRRNMVTFAEINKWSLESFDRMEDGGVSAALKHAEPFLAAFTSDADRQIITHEFDEVAAGGGHVSFEKITGDELREFEPSVSKIVTHGLRVDGQRFINPPSFMQVLAASVRARGATIVEGAKATGIRDLGAAGVAVDVEGQSAVLSNEVVIATGTWLGDLARQFGVRQVVQSGRGYSFSVKPPVIPTHPIYLPAQRVACTPLGDRLRVGGMMEFRSADAPADSRRIQTIVNAASPMFDGVDWDAREEEWVGSRPCTPDGLPLVGGTRSPRVHVAGGHGMWGVTLGPLTGRILADSITGGEKHPLLEAFDPLR
ncbi:D-amino-acid dehydrogenase [Salinibacterium amurskyense]|uniref:D-amino-acid dehydrogenase n=1 Tax=Salinibacterium amurskyense TaxID=205941 RepID=A0A2M9D6B7_9MICO|nr:FAD-dependent oxidoreductase [Salinibacterium amurskyense]PJJ81267.1 D-amino-acid dehydrogenase [Salinibacterium amurskyense]RLQ83282.1 FAD-binding oxidoreductase [Salinibacterium amurskyense]GHD81093.1 D-amino-acid dehydrogenase [Salinibacterium amurskyense]